MENNTLDYVPIPQKVTLSIREAAAYSGIGLNKIDALLRTPGCPFVLFIGTKKLVKRKQFEEFIYRGKGFYLIQSTVGR